MLNLLRSARRDNEPITRRTLLSAGTLGLAGLSLADLFRARAAGAATRPKQDVSVILLFFSGGPSQLETWDPKPAASSDIRGPLATIPTAVPGLHFSELLARQAKVADKMAVIRSMNHGHNDHDASQWMLSGYFYSRMADQNGFAYPSMGSVFAKLTESRQRLPSYYHLGPLGKFTATRAPEGYGAGYLGCRYDPIQVSGNLNGPGLAAPSVTADRFLERQVLLQQLDPAVRSLDRAQALQDMDGHYQKAFALITSEKTRAAFDLAGESPRIRDHYGPTVFGQCCLTARRLVEAGVRFVTVAWPDFSAWDTHADNFNKHKNTLTPPMDRAIAALVEDCHSRGLLDTTLILCMGEMGRTPKINSTAGRDHWQYCFSVAAAGGGVRGGQVIGASDRRGFDPADRPVTPEDLCATVYHKLGIDFTQELHDREGRPHKILPRGEPIAELL